MADDTAVPPYAALIDLCDVHKLHVGLHVAPKLSKNPRLECYRELEKLTVGIGAGATLVERVNADLDACAARMLSRLRTIPRFAAP